jgi:predicted ATPase
MDQSNICQVIMATHSPILMAYPGARLLRMAKRGLEPTSVEETDHCRLMLEFCADPTTFIEESLKA